MKQNGQITGFSEEISTLTNNVKDLENELIESKLKLVRLEYDFKEFEQKEEFSTKDSIVIRNIPVPHDGDDRRFFTEALSLLNIDDFIPEDDVNYEEA
jgi:hypothetical protein